MATLLSGPPAAGKSLRSRELLAASPNGVLVEFQPLYASALGVERLPTGRYPPRDPSRAYALAHTEGVRQASIRVAREQGLDPIASNTSGDPERRAFLLQLLGENAIEEVIDPGIEVVTSRLSVDGQLPDDCRRAIEHWYGAQRAAETIAVEVRQEASELDRHRHRGGQSGVWRTK